MLAAGTDNRGARGAEHERIPHLGGLRTAVWPPPRGIPVELTCNADSMTNPYVAPDPDVYEIIADPGHESSFGENTHVDDDD